MPAPVGPEDTAGVRTQSGNKADHDPIMANKIMNEAGVGNPSVTISSGKGDESPRVKVSVDIPDLGNKSMSVQKSVLDETLRQAFIKAFDTIMQSYH